MITTSGRSPKYFLVVFGEDPNKPPGEGGVYPHDKGYIGSSGVSAGDVLLPYQNLGAQGVGVVTGTETGGPIELIRYQYLPLCHSISWDSLDILRSTISELRTPIIVEGKLATRNK